MEQMGKLETTERHLSSSEYSTHSFFFLDLLERVEELDALLFGLEDKWYIGEGDFSQLVVELEATLLD